MIEDRKDANKELAKLNRLILVAKDEYLKLKKFNLVLELAIRDRERLLSDLDLLLDIRNQLESDVALLTAQSKEMILIASKIKSYKNIQINAIKYANTQ